MNGRIGTKAMVMVCMLLFFTSACSFGKETSVQITYDNSFESALIELVHTDGLAPLHDLTDWEWDRVSVFFEGDKTSFVETEVGTPLAGITDTRSDYLSIRGNLIVFQLENRVTKVIGTVIPRIQTNYDPDGRRSYSGRVIVLADPRGYDNCVLQDDKSSR